MSITLVTKKLYQQCRLVQAQNFKWGQTYIAIKPFPKTYI